MDCDDLRAFFGRKRARYVRHYLECERLGLKTGV